MKVLHICLGNFFADNFSYQENILPKFHKLFCEQIEVIASLETFDKNGKPTYSDTTGSYINEHGIKVTRIPYFLSSPITKKIRIYKNLYKNLEVANPDIIFMHGCQFLSIFTVARYLRQKPNVRLYVDNHADFYNSGSNILSKYILHKILWKLCAQKINKYTKYFYGVTPGRVDFLIKQYSLPQEKCRLLVMGGDDELVSNANEIKPAYRKELGISDNDFVIVTGGKINAYRPETLDLLKAVKKLNIAHIKLVVFGVVDATLKEEFDKLAQDKKIIYVGWLNGQETYNAMAIADLVIFPGLHSVMWEQACALGKPAIFRKLKGFDHLDLGGNALFLDDVSESNLMKHIEELINNKEKLQEMKKIAENKGMKTFSYKQIAKQSIEL